MEMSRGRIRKSIRPLFLYSTLFPYSAFFHILVVYLVVLLVDYL